LKSPKGFIYLLTAQSAFHLTEKFDTLHHKITKLNH